jgi:hypothetical protein
LKPPQIKDVSWEEINESWEGLFGLSSRLGVGVIKRDVQSALKDLEDIRTTQSFDDTLLKIWENKFYKWLDMLERKKDNRLMVCIC